MNRLLLYNAIVVFVLCPAVISPLVPVLAAAEQPDAAQRYYELYQAFAANTLTVDQMVAESDKAAKLQ